MKKSLKQRQQDIEAEIAELEADFAAMGEHAPPDLMTRLRNIKSEAETERKRITEIENRYTRVKRAAERAVPAHKALVVEMPKWRTTILLGLNSAAMVAVIGKTGLPGTVIKDAIWLFLLGALCALGAGSGLEFVGDTGLELADEFKAIDFDSRDLETELDRPVEISRKLAIARWLVSLLRYGSLGFFGWGVISVANNVGG
jgi:hypothetical protein